MGQIDDRSAMVSRGDAWARRSSRRDNRPVLDLHRCPPPLNRMSLRGQARRNAFSSRRTSDAFTAASRSTWSRPFSQESSAIRSPRATSCCAWSCTDRVGFIPSCDHSAASSTIGPAPRNRHRARGTGRSATTDADRVTPAMDAEEVSRYDAWCGPIGPPWHPGSAPWNASTSRRPTRLDWSACRPGPSSGGSRGATLSPSAVRIAAVTCCGKPTCSG